MELIGGWPCSYTPDAQRGRRIEAYPYIYRTSGLAMTSFPQNERIASYQVDVYSYSMILFEIICREIPFEDEEKPHITLFSLEGLRSSNLPISTRPPAF